MHILSLSDIQLIVDLFETQGAMSDVNGRERQIDNLIRTGYLRPLRGVYVLTELGEKTARSLQMRQFVPPRLLITNSSHGNERPIDMVIEHATIVGVVEQIILPH